MFRDLLTGDASAGITRILLPEEYSSDRVIIADTQLLFSAHFKKSGADLILTGYDGHTVIVAGYFNLSKRPDLVAPGGSSLTANVVERLAGPENPEQYAQIGAPTGAAVIGRVERVSGSASVQHANGVVQEAKTGDSILQGDVIETRDGSVLGISMVDGTAFSMGASARMVLSELDYSANSTSNSATFSLVKGAISFIAGQVAKTGDMRVDTPLATLGIRGTTVNTNITADINGNAVSVTYSLSVDPDGHVGSISVLDRLTGAIIGTITTTDTTFTVVPTNLGISATQTGKTQEQVAGELAVAAELFPIFLANPQNFNNQNPAPQDIQPKAPTGTHGSSSPPSGGSTQTFSDTNIDSSDGGTDQNHKPPDITNTTDASGKPTITVTIHSNSAPSVFANVPQHLIEDVTHGDQGVATSISHITKVDLDGNVSYDTNILIGAGWISGEGGIFTKQGTYGVAELDKANNTLTYILDNIKAEPLGADDHKTESFTIPVVDNEGATASTTIDFTIDGRELWSKVGDGVDQEGGISWG